MCYLQDFQLRQYSSCLWEAVNASFERGFGTFTLDLSLPVSGVLKVQLAGSHRAVMPRHASWQSYPAASLECGTPL